MNFLSFSTWSLSKASQAIATAAIVALAVAVFGGNKAIGIGHGLVILAFILWVIDWLRRGAKTQKPPADFLARKSLWALIALVLAMGLSMAVNWDSYVNPWRDFKKIRYEIIVLILCLVPVFGSRLFEKKYVQRTILWSCLTVAFVVTVTGIYAVKTGNHPLIEMSAKRVAEQRVGGISGSVMTYAYTIQFLVLLGVSAMFSRGDARQWIESMTPRKWLSWGIVGVMLMTFLIGAYLSLSRGAILGCVCGGLALLCLLRSGWLWGLAIIFAVFVGFYTFKKEPRLKKRLDRPLKMETVRLSQWKAATLTFLDHPMFGVGHRQFEKQAVELKKKYRMPMDHRGKEFFKGHAHNNILEAFASTGMIGGLAFLAFCFAWMHEMFRSTHTKIFFIPVLVAFLVSGLFENTFTDSEVLNSILLLYLISQVVLCWETNGRVGIKTEVSCKK